MKSGLQLALVVLAGVLSSAQLAGQTYVTPMMGGGQVWADMVHIDIWYDADANQLHAQVDDSLGIPELRPLEAGYAFDPQEPYSALNGKAYNAQYGWNVGGFFTMPPGAAIWIELTQGSPGLETYSGSGQYASYSPIFGTAGSPRLWKWSGVMVHNTYSVVLPSSSRYFAEYHIFFGDAVTGSRTNYANLADTTVRLEWTTVQVADTETLRFGVVDQTHSAPLELVNSDCCTTNSLAVMNLCYTNEGPLAGQFQCRPAMLALPATAANGGPATNHAELGSCLAAQIVSLTGRAGANLTFWEPEQSQPSFSIPVGEVAGTNRFLISQNAGASNCDPYGAVQGRRLAVNFPGLYCLGFRLIDVSTNGPAGAPLHSPSPLYYLYLQAGLTISSLTHLGDSPAVLFGGEAGKAFYLENSPAVGPSVMWQTVAGPINGSNCLQILTAPPTGGTSGFFRLRAE